MDQGTHTTRTFLAIVASFLIVQAFAQQSPAATDPTVKKSRAGICHERGTVSYIQTIYFDSYPSMQSCLDSGGRLANSPSAPVPHDRSIHWWERFTREDADKAVAFAVIALVVLALAVAVLRPVYLKHKQRRKFRVFCGSGETEVGRA